jgi:hypothetical protein
VIWRPRPAHAVTSLPPWSAVALAVVAVLTIGIGSGSAGRPGTGTQRPDAAAKPGSEASATGDLSGGPSGTSPVGRNDPSRPGRQPTPVDPGASARLAADGIPAIALDAYRKAAAHVATSDPACGLPWTLLAAIGRVESNHGRFAGAVLHPDGTSTPKIIGIALNGVGTALIRDSDGGRLDGDAVLDRAVGPMQFIPTTWQGYAADGNGDRITDPFNIYDAALAAAHYLCAAGGDLRATAGKTRAVLAYNHSDSYLALVLSLDATYAGRTPPTTGPLPGTTVLPPKIPAVDPGPPLALQHELTSVAAVAAGRPPGSTGGMPAGGSTVPPGSSGQGPSVTPVTSPTPPTSTAPTTLSPPPSSTASHPCPTPSTSATTTTSTATAAPSASTPAPTTSSASPSGTPASSSSTPPPPTC